MRAQLQEALDHGATGLSTGLAYLSAFYASTEEVLALAELLAAAGAIYTTHHAQRNRDHPAIDGRGCTNRPARSRPGADFASEMRRHRELGTKRGSLRVARSGAEEPVHRLRLLSVCGRLQHARPASSGRASQNPDHLVKGASGNGWADFGADCEAPGECRRSRPPNACNRRGPSITALQNRTCRPFCDIPGQ